MQEPERPGSLKDNRDGYNHASHHRAYRSSARRRRLVRPRTLVLRSASDCLSSLNGEAVPRCKAANLGSPVGGVEVRAGTGSEGSLRGRVSSLSFD